jgi:phospholipid/cholesterol/gamma-HCH transport system substrate-binding protein
LRLSVLALVASVTMAAVPGCEWRGLNSLPAPGTEGGGPGAFNIKAQLPDVGYIQANSRVRVGDVNIGTVTKIEREGWHALVTMRVNGDVDLPSNATAAVGQTSLLGSLHIELAPPVDAAPVGRLHDGSLIPLSAGREYPSTEQSLSALSLLLNGGGIGQIQDVTKALSTAFTGREDDLRNLITQVDRFVTSVDAQTGDIISATDNLNNLVGKFADQKPMLDKAIATSGTT